jgi:hypothetical protein
LRFEGVVNLNLVLSPFDKQHWCTTRFTRYRQSKCQSTGGKVETYSLKN